MTDDKVSFLKKVKTNILQKEGYLLDDVDELKPWGAYYRLDEGQSAKFIRQYFPGKTIEELGKGGSLSPKILVFEPGKKLSLQFHNRRAEIWRVIEGTLIAALSDTDEEGEWREYGVGESLSYDALIRHRAGAPEEGEWVVVAEVWQHTDKNNPTDESDIVRLKDDFGRA